MAKLIYSAIASLDGYVEDEAGRFDWAEPDEEVHAFANDLEREVGTHLLGRRMYETMAVWETDASLAAQSDLLRDFTQTWQSAEKVVYSMTLESAWTKRTRLERAFEPQAVRQLKATAEADLSVGGADLAGQAIRAGLVDEYRLFIVPMIVGGGKPSLPHDVRVGLELLDQRRFAGGVVYLHYGLST